MPTNCTIRFAVAADVPLILQFIRQLADYERLTDRVVADEAALERTLFGPRAYAEVLVCEVESQAVGFALFFHNYSTFLARPGIYLEDLFIDPAFRGRGCGRALLQRLAQLACERNCGRIEWSVLDWNQPAINFYKSLGAEPLSEWTTYRLAAPHLERLAARLI